MTSSLYAFGGFCHAQTGYCYAVLGELGFGDLIESVPISKPTTAAGGFLLDGLILILSYSRFAELATRHIVASNPQRVKLDVRGLEVRG